MMNKNSNFINGHVTFVLPNYNHSQFLERSLGNALKQIRPADKIIIVDDASTDNSLEVVQKMIKNHPQVELVQHKDNKGCVYTLSEGFERTDTEFVSFLAADDVLDLSYLKK